MCHKFRNFIYDIIYFINHNIIFQYCLNKILSSNNNKKIIILKFLGLYYLKKFLIKINYFYIKK